MSESRRNPNLFSSYHNRLQDMARAAAAVDPTTGQLGLNKILMPELRKEQPTVLGEKFNDVAAATSQLCLHVSRIAKKYGVKGDEYYLEEAVVGDPNSAGVALALMLNSIYGNRSYFQVTRTSGVDWSVYYGQVPGMVQSSKGVRAVLIPANEASIETKRLLLRHSPMFMRAYLEKVNASVSDVNTDLGAGLAVIEELAKM